MENNIEVIAYGRNSDKAQKTSQDIQDDAFTHFANNAFRTLFGGQPAEIVENYKDHGKSASKKRQLHKRHDFHRMLDDVRAGTIRGSGRPFPKIILVLNTSRFSRLHELDTLALYNVLRENDVKLVSIDDRKVYDFDGFAQIIDLLVKAKEDKEYSRKIAQNALRGLVWTTRLGRCHQRFSPYGMMKLVITDTKEEMLIARQRSFNKPKDWQSFLIPGDALEQDVIRAIFQMFKERDVSYTELGRIFSTHPNLKYRLGPTGNGWHEQTIKHILGNLHYAGYEFIGQETSGEHFRFNGEDVVDAKDFTMNNPLIVDVTLPEIGHPKQGAVVDRKLFWEIQEKRKRKAEKKSKPKSTDLNPEGYTLGGGILLCGSCGKPLYGHHNQGRGNLYVCKGAKQGRCGYWSVKEEDVLPWLLTAIDREVWRQREDKPTMPDEVDIGNSLKDDIAKLERKIIMFRGKINAADDADAAANMTDMMNTAIKRKKDLEAQTVQTDRRERLLAAQERWELFVQPMLVAIKTGRLGHDSQELLEEMGIDQSEIDRLFNFTMVRPSVVRETLLSYNTEVKLWFAEKKQGGRATGSRKAWEVDMGRLDARIGSLRLTPDNHFRGRHRCSHHSARRVVDREVS